MSAPTNLLSNPFDIETIPAQGNAYEEFLEAEKENFKAPSSLSKTQVLADFGVSDKDPDWKYKTKDDCIALWEQRFASIKAPEVAEEKWRKTALDGTQGEIICMSVMVEQDQIESLYRRLDDSEGDLLQSFYDLMAGKLNRRDPFFIGHNIGNFDLKFLYQRSVIVGVKPSFNIPVSGSHGRDYFDNMVAWTGYRKEYISQDRLAKALGLPGKPENIDGSKVWDFVKEGKEAEVSAYCADDVRQSMQIYRRLNFIEPPVAGSIIDDGLPF